MQSHIQVPPQLDLTQSLLALVGGTGCLSRQPNTGEHALAIGSGGVRGGWVAIDFVAQIRFGECAGMELMVLCVQGVVIIRRLVGLSESANANTHTHRPGGAGVQGYQDLLGVQLGSC